MRVVGLLDVDYARVADPLFDAAWWGWVVRYHHPERWIVAWPELLRWLVAHRDEPKFVITSIPFIAEVHERDDKWCGDEYRVQRQQIIDHLGNNQIGRLCFLTGDMHCSYHAQMTIAPPAGNPITIHELMSSPINQVTSGSHGFIAEPLPDTTSTGVTYQTAKLDLAEFYGEHSNVMVVRYSRTNRRVSWQIHRTKPDVPPPLGGGFDL